MQRITIVIIENFIQMPDRYPNTSLSEILMMSAHQYKKYMKTTTLIEITQKLAQDAYALALQDP
jgi:hypothetical protein